MGLGNSTRAFAVIEKLHQAGHAIDVLTFGNGFEFFRGRPEIRNLDTIFAARYSLSMKSIHWLSPALSLFRLISSGLKNVRIIGRHLRERSYDCVILDSNFNLFLRHFTAAPIVSLNNADQILKAAAGRGGIPLFLWPQFLVELADFLFQWWIPDLVLSPWFGPGGARSGRFVPLEPIARECFHRPLSERAAIRNVLVTYSGSGIGEDMHEGLLDQTDCTVTVIGRAGKSGDRIRFFEKLRDASPYFAACDVVICNAGFSSLSEALASKKPMLLWPIPGHAEQYLNARRLEGLGVALVSSSPRMTTAFDTMVKRYSSFTAAYRNISWDCQGASQAAKEIESLLRRSETGRAGL